MSNQRKISYVDRDFLGVRNQLINYVKTYYPDQIQNFNDTGIFSVLLDLNAGVTDSLNYQIDRTANELFLNTAQQRSSLYNFAVTNGIKIPGNRPSIAIVEVSVNVPVNGDKENVDYLPILKSGAKIIGGGQTFETVADIDFSSAFNQFGTPNRTKIPNFNSNSKLISYTIVKQEIVVNGETKIFKKIVNNNDVKPFVQIILPDKNVLSITSIITKDGINFTTNPTDNDFNNENLKWYEVESLADKKVFIDDTSTDSDSFGIVKGKYLETNKKFTFEYTPESYGVVTFGGATNELDSINQFILNDYQINLNQIINNFSLGTSLKSNTTLFIKYRVGGGQTSILGQNTLTQFSQYDLIVNGSNEKLNQAVKSSIKVNNITNTFGGANPPTLEEIRNYIKYNFSSQNRCVTEEDYQVVIKKIPGRYGSPSKFSTYLKDNKMIISVLGYNPDGNITSTVSSNLLNNLSLYLSKYKMFNDYISIEVGEVINLSFDVYILLDRNFNPNNVTIDIVNVFKEYFSNSNIDMGKNIVMGDLQTNISNLSSVRNLINIDVFNKVGGKYESGQVNQPYIDSNTKQIGLIDNSIFIDRNQLATIKDFNTDIRVFFK